MTPIDTIKRDCLEALEAKLAADIHLAEQIDKCNNAAAVAAAQDATYTYFAALTRFKFEVRKLGTGEQE